MRNEASGKRVISVIVSGLEFWLLLDKPVFSEATVVYEKWCKKAGSQ